MDKETKKHIYCFQTDSFRNVSFSEGFENGHLLDQLKYEKKLGFHEGFHEVGKNKGVGDLNFLKMVAEIIVDIFTSVSNE